MTAPQRWVGFGLALVALGCSASIQDNALSPAAMAPAINAPAASVANLAEALPRSEPATLWDHLRQADRRLYVVLLRHALAPGTGDPPGFRVDDCTTQRNLSEAGRQQARAMGQAFRQWG